MEAYPAESAGFQNVDTAEDADLFSRASTAGTSDAGTGRLNRYPCAWSHFKRRSFCSCSGVSTPHQTVFIVQSRASDTTVEAKFATLVASAIPCMKERSILSVSTGSLPSRRNEEYPVPKSAMATPRPA